MVRGVSFYGALADLLAGLVTTDMPHVDMITVAYAVSGWRMTTASKTTAAQLNGTDRVLYINGTYQVAPAGTSRASFAFPPPIGTRTVLVDYPAGEVVTIPRHVPAQSVRALMTADTFTEDAVFTSENLDPAARAIGFHHRRARGLGNQYPRWLPARPRHLPSRRHHLRRGGQPPRPRPRPARRGCSQRHRSIPARSLPAHSPTTRPIHDDLAAEITRNRMPVTRAGIDPSPSGGTRCSATANSPSDRSAYSARAATAAPVIDLASSNSVFARMLPVSRTAARCHTRAAARHIRRGPRRFHRRRCSVPRHITNGITARRHLMVG